jgi:hypothetical protein
MQASTFVNVHNVKLNAMFLALSMVIALKLFGNQSVKVIMRSNPRTLCAVSGGRSLSLSPRTTIVASVGALAVWLVVLLGTIQVAYMSDAYSLLGHDIALALGALVGFAGTIWFIFGRSRLGLNGRIVITVTCLIAFLFLTFWGVLFVACANGNCL